MKSKIKLIKSSSRLKNEYDALLKYTETLHLEYKRFRSYIRLCEVRGELPNPDATPQEVKNLFIKHCTRKKD